MRLRHPVWLAATRKTVPHVYLATDERLVALRSTDGTVAWTYEYPAAHSGEWRPKVDCDLERVWVGWADRVVQLSRTGTVQWTSTRSGASLIQLAGGNGRVAAAWLSPETGPQTGGREVWLRSFDPAGSQLWPEVDTAAVIFQGISSSVRPPSTMSYDPAGTTLTFRFGSRAGDAGETVPRRHHIVTVTPEGSASATGFSANVSQAWGLSPADERDVTFTFAIVNNINTLASRVRWQTRAAANQARIDLPPPDGSTHQIRQLNFFTGAPIDVWLQTSSAPGTVEIDNRSGFYTSSGSLLTARRYGGSQRWTYTAPESVRSVVAEPGRWAITNRTSVTLP